MTPLRGSRWRQRRLVEEGAHRCKAIPSPATVEHHSNQTLYGVPTFKALQDICVKYLIEHPYVPSVDSPTCKCRLRATTYDEWLEHVTELQASHIAVAIQEARNTPD